MSNSNPNIVLGEKSRLQPVFFRQRENQFLDQWGFVNHSDGKSHYSFEGLWVELSPIESNWSRQITNALSGNKNYERRVANRVY